MNRSILVLPLFATGALPAALAQSPFTITGVSAEALESVADLTGDGRRELVLGIPSSDRVEIRNSVSGALIFSTLGAAGSRFGTSLANIGDINADGKEDILVGAPLASPVGQATVLSSSGLSVLRQWTPLNPSIVCAGAGQRYGYSVARIGDLNGDSIAEVAVGDPQWTVTPGTCWADGQVEVVDVSGPPTLMSAINGIGVPAAVNPAMCVLTAVGPQLGFSLCSLGDVNGDSQPELVIGAAGHDAALAYSGASLLPPNTPLLLARMPGAAWQAAGISVAPIGDVDGDGKPELVVGVGDPNFGTSSTTYRYYGHKIGAAGGASIRPYGTFSLGGAAGTQLGWCVATLGDVNGDAIPDFLAGSGSPCTFTSSNAYIFDGLGGGILQSFPSVSTTQGQAVHAVGELAFGTGLPRYMISDPASASVLVR